jgi:hypothetical protein
MKINPSRNSKRISDAASSARYSSSVAVETELRFALISLRPFPPRPARRFSLRSRTGFGLPSFGALDLTMRNEEVSTSLFGFDLTIEDHLSNPCIGDL